MHTQCNRGAYAGLVRMQCRSTDHMRCLTRVYVPWPQKETKEQQKTAEAKIEEQETKGTKAEGQKPEVPSAPSPPPSPLR